MPSPLGSDDMLRRLPSVVDPLTRLRLDTHVYCHDVILVNLDRLIASCERVDTEVVDSLLVANLFSSAWSIIDQLDIARQVLQADSGERGPLTKELLQEARYGRTMRNHMDHISGRMPTLIAKKGVAEPLFGTLSFVRCSENELASRQSGKYYHYNVIVIAHGTIAGMHGSSGFDFDSTKIDAPISNIRLSSQGASVRLDSVCELYTSIINGLSESVTTSINGQLGNWMEQFGVTEAEALSATPTTITAEIEFGQATQSPGDLL